MHSIFITIEKFYVCLDVQFTLLFQEIRKLRESDTDVKEFHKKKAEKTRKTEKSLLEVHQSKIAKKKRVICFLNHIFEITGYIYFFN